MTSVDIRRTLVLRAPRTKVWDALVTHEGWSSWFGRSLVGELQPGETLKMDFGSDGTCWAIVTERVEGEAFAYKWHPGEDCPIDKYPEDEMTVVRFSLEDHPDGTLLNLVESGFEHISMSRREKCVELNSHGWDWEIEELRAFIEEGTKHSKSGTQ